MGGGRRKLVWIDRGAVRRLKVLFSVLAVLFVAAYRMMVVMPGRSHRGPLPPLTEHQAELAARLKADLTVLAGDIGDRNVFESKGLHAAEAFLEQQFREAGYLVERQTYKAIAEPVSNLIAELPGTTRAGEIVVVGAHYDSVGAGGRCPGANDNGSGTVALLALARAFAHQRPARTVRFVAFVNEEPPFFWERTMGSWVYARACRERGDRIVDMLCLECLGWYTDRPQSQQYPLPGLELLYPTTGNFVAFVSDTGSRHELRRGLAAFRRAEPFPSEGMDCFSLIKGIGWSDQWSFWQEGYPGVMVTDTAVFRYPHYHQATDTPDKVDYERLARVVDGLEAVVATYANPAG